MRAALLIRAAKWIGLAYLAVVATLLFSWADAIDAVLIDLIVIPWIVGPAGIAALCAKASKTGAGTTAFVFFEAAIIASTAFVWIDLILIHRDAQNGIAMGVFVPLYQYGAVAIFYAVAYLFAGARAKNG